jgi:hypothetical protein
MPTWVTNLIEDNISRPVAAQVLEIMREQWSETQKQVHGPTTNGSLPRSSLDAALAQPTDQVATSGKGGPPKGELTRSGESSAYGASAMGSPDGDVSWEQKELMLKHYLVRFCLDVRSIPLILVFRNDPGQGWDIKVQDENEQVQQFTRAALQRILLRLVRECQTARFYGFYAGEKVWTVVTGDELGMGDSRAYNVLDKVKGNHPRTVKLLRDEKTDQFDGYEQSAPGMATPVRVPAEKAFVYTYRKEFGNLYGRGLAQVLFTPWWWLEFIWRALMRYMERMGTPVAVCYAPQGEKVADASGTMKDAMDIGLNLAIDVGRSNAVVLPSNNWAAEDGGGPKWRLEYLQDSGVAAQFDTVLSRLETSVIRAAGEPDQIIGQQAEGQTGAYAAWKVPSGIFEQTLEIDLAEFTEHLNAYLLPDLGRWNYGDQYGRRGMISATVAGMDSSSLERLMQVLPSLIAKPEGDYIDVLETFRQADIPVLSDEEIERVKAEKEEQREQFNAAKAKSQGAEGEAPTEESEKAPAEEPGTTRIRGAELTSAEFFRYAADKMMAADGYITIKGRSAAEFQEKARLLAQAGVPADWPVHHEWIGVQVEG